MNWSQTVIVGNVGRAPQLRYTQSGVPVCDFSVAVTRRGGAVDDDQRADKTTWFRVTCWRKTAELAAQYVVIGQLVMVVGAVEARAYLNKAGQPAAALDLTADHLVLLHSGGGTRADDWEASQVPF